MARRTLSIRRERLTELTNDELAAVAGGSGKLCDLITGLCPTWDCTGCHLTCGC